MSRILRLHRDDQAAVADSDQLVLLYIKMRFFFIVFGDTLNITIFAQEAMAYQEFINRLELGSECKPVPVRYF